MAKRKGAASSTAPTAPQPPPTTRSRQNAQTVEAERASQQPSGTSSRVEDAEDDKAPRRSTRPKKAPKDNDEYIYPTKSTASKTPADNATDNTANLPTRKMKGLKPSSAAAPLKPKIKATPVQTPAKRTKLSGNARNRPKKTLDDAGSPPSDDEYKKDDDTLPTDDEETPIQPKRRPRSPKKKTQPALEDVEEDEEDQGSKEADRDQEGDEESDEDHESIVGPQPQPNLRTHSSKTKTMVQAIPVGEATEQDDEEQDKEADEEHNNNNKHADDEDQEEDEEDDGGHGRGEAKEVEERQGINDDDDEDDGEQHEQTVGGKMTPRGLQASTARDEDSSASPPPRRTSGRRIAAKPIQSTALHEDDDQASQESDASDSSAGATLEREKQKRQKARERAVQNGDDPSSSSGSDDSMQSKSAGGGRPKKRTGKKNKKAKNKGKGKESTASSLDQELPSDVDANDSDSPPQPSYKHGQLSASDNALIDDLIERGQQVAKQINRSYATVLDKMGSKKPNYRQGNSWSLWLIIWKAVFDSEVKQELLNKDPDEDSLRQRVNAARKNAYKDHKKNFRPISKRRKDRQAAQRKLYDHLYSLYKEELDKLPEVKKIVSALERMLKAEKDVEDISKRLSIHGDIHMIALLCYTGDNDDARSICKFITGDDAFTALMSKHTTLTKKIERYVMSILSGNAIEAEFPLDDLSAGVSKGSGPSTTKRKRNVEDEPSRSTKKHKKHNEPEPAHSEKKQKRAKAVKPEDVKWIIIDGKRVPEKGMSWRGRTLQWGAASAHFLQLLIDVGLGKGTKAVPWKHICEKLYEFRRRIVNWPAGTPAPGPNFSIKKFPDKAALCECKLERWAMHEIAATALHRGRIPLVVDTAGEVLVRCKGSNCKKYIEECKQARTEETRRRAKEEAQSNAKAHEIATALRDIKKNQKPMKEAKEKVDRIIQQAALEGNGDDLEEAEEEVYQEVEDSEGGGDLGECDEEEDEEEQPRRRARVAVSLVDEEPLLTDDEEGASSVNEVWDMMVDDGAIPSSSPPSHSPKASTSSTKIRRIDFAAPGGPRYVTPPPT